VRITTPTCGSSRPHPLRRFDARELRQVHLDDEDVRLELDRFRDSVLSVGDDGEDLHVGFLLEDLHDAECGEAAGVGENDPDGLLWLIGQAHPPPCPVEAGV